MEKAKQEPIFRIICGKCSNERVLKDDTESDQRPIMVFPYTRQELIVHCYECSQEVVLHMEM